MKSERMPPCEWSHADDPPFICRPSRVPAPLTIACPTSLQHFPMSTTQSLGSQYILYNGPLFIGTMFNWALFGVVALQVYIYSSSGFKDSKWIRGLVGTIFVLDILQTIFATHCVWQLVILGWGDPSVFAFPPWTSVTFPIMSGIIGALVQMFFAWRIWILQNNLLGRCIAVCIVLIALMQCSSGIVFAIRSAFIDILEIDKLHPGIIVWLVGAFTCDIIIVVAMLSILHSAKKPNFEGTNRLIDRLMIQAVHSGAITAVAALVELILFLVAPDNFMHDCPVLFLGKLYSNVLLANLNGRRKNDTSYSTVFDSKQLSSRTGVIDVDSARFAPSDTDLNAGTIIKTFRHVEQGAKDAV
ncbi:hypothetical protein FPV67DRAFT_1157671 [Lyophyllum atratum]|nr:hypothetical protein FPV67DRAFT_1157671 [Lyophyllum atratum]